MNASRLIHSTFMAALATGVLTAPLTAVAAEGPEFPSESLAQLDGTVNNRTTRSSDYLGSPLSLQQAADDFAVPAGESWWLVSEVKYVGQSCISAADGDVPIVAFLNTDTVTGKPNVVVQSSIAEFMGDPVFTCSSSAGNSEFTLSIANQRAFLKPGQTYWLSIYGRVTTISQSRVLWWATRSTQTGSPAHYYTGTVDGCRNEWAPRRDCDGQSNQDADLAWAITYTQWTPSDFLSIPMISQRR